MADPTKKEQTGFGTFGGVFTPCVLTILGVIMFLRFGQVIGRAGLWQGLGIVLLAKAITSLTAMSLSSIATNQRVKGGGAYFLISRSLGVEFGASIGVVFFIAQAVSVAMYVLGFTEAFQSQFPGSGASPVVIASVVNAAVFGCVLIGAAWTLKLQYGILAALVVAIIAFFLGAFEAGSRETFQSNLGPDYGEGGSFFASFALFFPAATGIMAGANMSGDLRDPGRSIPLGTLGAIGFTAVVYVGIALLLAWCAPRTELIANGMLMRDISALPVAITIGVFAATLSSALGSMMGAPRILQALARDRIYPRIQIFAKGSGKAQEPRYAIVLTWVIAQLGILVGDLNAIAPVITMFFMITYGYLNLATFYESRARNPSYRPTFRLSHWSTALAGTIGCGLVMLLVSPVWSFFAVLAMIGIHFYTARLEVVSSWGDVMSGAGFERARRSLLALEAERYHPKNWRPSILVLAGPAGERVRLDVLGHWLTGQRGLLTSAQVISGDVDALIERRRSQEDLLRKYIRETGLEAFAAVTVARSQGAGIEALVQCNGIGALRPNLALLGWPTDPERFGSFGNNVRTISRLRRSMALARMITTGADPWVAPGGTVDVWWRGERNGHLLVLLAHLLTQTDAWAGHRVRLGRIVGAESGVAGATEHLEELIRSTRVVAEPVVFVGDGDVAKSMRRASSGAALVFVGFEPPDEGKEEEWVARVDALMLGLPSVVAVWNAGDVHAEA
ncbi:MAG: amino acid permease [bacterium]|nr:amino acid permease [bacterium]